MRAARAVDIVGQVARALDAAHADGLIHRDVKPSNVLISGADGDEFAYLIDFGISRTLAGSGGTSITVTGATVGPLDYMAPERFLGGPIDGRVDVHSLACLLFEPLTGAKPFGVPVALDGAMPGGWPRTPSSGIPRRGRGCRRPRRASRVDGGDEAAKRERGVSFWELPDGMAMVSWRRILTDPVTGAPTDYGTTVYRPLAALRDLVLTRTLICGFPSCLAPAHRGDLDCYCRRHHRAKHTEGWSVEQGEHGTITWTSPSGHTWTHQPDPIAEPVPKRPPPDLDEPAPF